MKHIYLTVGDKLTEAILQKLIEHLQEKKIDIFHASISDAAGITTLIGNAEDAESKKQIWAGAATDKPATLESLNLQLASIFDELALVKITGESTHEKLTNFIEADARDDKKLVTGLQETGALPQPRKRNSKTTPAPDAPKDTVADAPKDTAPEAPKDTVADAPKDTAPEAPKDTVGDAPETTGDDDGNTNSAEHQQE